MLPYSVLSALAFFFLFCSVRMAICVLFAFASFVIVACSHALWFSLLGEIWELYMCSWVSIEMKESLNYKVVEEIKGHIH